MASLARRFHICFVHTCTVERLTNFLAGNHGNFANKYDTFIDEYLPISPVNLCYKRILKCVSDMKVCRIIHQLILVPLQTSGVSIFAKKKQKQNRQIPETPRDGSEKKANVPPPRLYRK